eukprot:gene824-9074_t
MHKAPFLSNDQPTEENFTLSNSYYVEYNRTREHLNSSLFLNAKITVFEDETAQIVHSRYIKIHFDNSHRWNLQLLGQDQDFDSCFIVKEKSDSSSKPYTGPKKMTIDQSGKYPTGTTVIGGDSGYGDANEVKETLERYINKKM